MVTREVTTRIPTKYGDFQLYFYSNTLDDKEHLAFVKGDVSGQQDILVRVHSECFTGDVLGSQRCDCGEQLENSLKLISEEGRGVFIYMRQEGRGIGLFEKLRAYNLQDQGFDTVDANLELGHESDQRDYTITAEILKDLDVYSIQLITNNPLKIESLENSGIKVEKRIPQVPSINANNAGYLETKILKMDHLLDFPFEKSGDK
ncbi:MAG: GTP cyclohydrolase II [Chloroflexi bacterium]|nr:GTP cyclohydrolase II [Chloroflexota bacterium]MBT4003937.1 GTP cyclohydrolase II [Chloroflexota bacterium]MBT4305757.1 GTP cyclohydrolase II [Chloroflexota bacterium]MBT4533581.1 GTP cyclohydrolase II [Chloroflexota bacterium]MBT4681776.1 GTP cyclohydrolase II [Chloroflexota bacterium]